MVDPIIDSLNGVTLVANGTCVVGETPTIVLLTHPTEFSHPTNTASLVLDIAAQHQLPVQQYSWHRTEVLDWFNPEQAVLLYPSESSIAWHVDLDKPAVAMPAAVQGKTSWVVVDATWQRAQKMLNQTPALQAASKLQLTSKQASVFKRRRNQRLGAFCTAEICSLLWHGFGQTEASSALFQRFIQFNSQKG